MQSVEDRFTPYSYPHLELLPLTHIPGRSSKLGITLGIVLELCPTPWRTSGNSDTDKQYHPKHLSILFMQQHAPVWMPPPSAVRTGNRTQVYFVHSDGEVVFLSPAIIPCNLDLSTIKALYQNAP
jgi:hypothetical protein